MSEAAPPPPTAGPDPDLGLGGIPPLPPGFGPDYTPELVPEIAHLKGPHMLGFILAAVFFGVTLMAFFHWVTFAWFSETRKTRALVICAMCTATTTIAYTLVYELRQFIFQFGKSPTQHDALWSSINYLLDAISRFPVAMYFAFRAYELWDKRKILLPVLALSVILPSVASIAACGTHQLEGQGVRPSHGIVDKAWVISEIAGNYLITGLIGFRLIKTGQAWRASDRVTSKARKLVIESMAGPTFISTAMIFIMTLAPYATYMDVFTFVPLAYTVALMVLLTAQFSISAHRWTSSHGEYETYTHNGVVKSRRMAPNVNVTTEVYQHTDRVETGIARDDSDGQARSAIRSQSKRRAYGIDEEIEMEDQLAPRSARPFAGREPESVTVRL